MAFFVACHQRTAVPSKVGAATQPMCEAFHGGGGRRILGIAAGWVPLPGRSGHLLIPTLRVYAPPPYHSHAWGAASSRVNQHECSSMRLRSIVHRDENFWKKEVKLLNWSNTSLTFGSKVDEGNGSTGPRILRYMAPCTAGVWGFGVWILEFGGWSLGFEFWGLGFGI